MTNKMKTELDLLILKAFALSLLLTSCVSSQAPIDSQESKNKDNAQQTTISVPVDLSAPQNVSQPWKFVFVSQDGPKGHQNISPEQCPDIVWCNMWQATQKQGEALGIQTELAFVQEDCQESSQCTRQQIELLAQLIERDDIDGLIIGPRDSNKLVPVVEKAIEKDIAVLAIGTPINSKKVLSLISFHEFKGGQMIGEWVKQQLSGSGNVLVIEGPKKQKNALARRHGFIAGLGNSNMTVLDTASAPWTCDRAQEITETWLQKYPKIDAIIAASDHMAMGAMIATLQKKRSPLLITGYDATPIGLEAIQQGHLGATVQQSPGMGAKVAINLLVRHLETQETYPKEVFVPTAKLVEAKNLERVQIKRVEFDAPSLSCARFST